MKKEDWLKQKADDIARDQGFACADFIGMDGDLSIFMGNNVQDGEPTVTGLPLWISVDKDGNTDFDFDFKYMYLVKED